MVKRQKLFERLDNFLDNKWTNIKDLYGVIGFVLLGFFTIESDFYIFSKSFLNFAIILISLIGYVFLWYKSLKEQESVSQIEDKYFLEKNIDREAIRTLSEKLNSLENEFNYQNENLLKLFDAYLGLLANAVDFNFKHRISVYKVSNDRFVLVGRYSQNMQFCSPNNTRNKYPINEGLIAKAWNEQDFFIDNLSDPNSNFDVYKSELNNCYAISDQFMNSMRMKSRTFYIKRIYGLNPLYPKALIVFEGIEKNAFTKESVDSHYKSMENSLKYFIENIEITSKKTNIAENSGF